VKLKKIEILKYKSCDKTILDVNGNLTVLIGVNGSGKTSILSAIKLLKSIATSRHIYEETKSDNLFETVVIATFIDNTYEVEVKATFNYDIGSQTQEEISSIKTEWRIQKIVQRKWLEIPIEVLILENRLKNINNEEVSRRYLSHKSYEKYIGLKNETPKEFFLSAAKAVSFIMAISYYSATQFSDPHKSPTSVELEEREVNSNYRYGRRHGPHTNFVMDLVKMQREQNGKYERYLNLIGPNGIGLIDSLAFDEVKFSSEEVNVKSGGKIVTEKRSKLIVVPKISIGKKTLSFNQLSEGTFKTIAVLFYILHKDNSLLLLEEPEVCVHHGLLKSVIEVIKNESLEKQIIISTHSDFVLDQVRPDNLVIVSRTNEKGTTAKCLNKTLSKNNYKALHAYLEEVGNLGEFWKEGGLDE